MTQLFPMMPDDATRDFEKIREKLAVPPTPR